MDGTPKSVCGDDAAADDMVPSDPKIRDVDERLLFVFVEPPLTGIAMKSLMTIVLLMLMAIALSTFAARRSRPVAA